MISTTEKVKLGTEKERRNGAVTLDGEMVSHRFANLPERLASEK